MKQREITFWGLKIKVKTEKREMKRKAKFFDTHRTKNQADKLGNLSLLNCIVIGRVQQNILP